MKKMLLTVMIIVLVIFGVLGAYALREIGTSPSAEEIKSYEKLSYFRNGEFQSPQQMVYDFDNVRNGPAGMWRFLSRSPFAPVKELPQVALSRGSFPEQPEDFTDTVPNRGMIFCVKKYSHTTPKEKYTSTRTKYLFRTGRKATLEISSIYSAKKTAY